MPPQKYHKDKNGLYKCPHCDMKFDLPQYVSKHCKVFHIRYYKLYTKHKQHKPSQNTMKIIIQNKVIEVYDFQNTTYKKIIIYT